MIAIWATIFYFAILDEIYDSIDDGLDNQKGLIIQKAATDSSILLQSDFEERDYQIKPVSPVAALNVYDSYSDTLMFMQNENDFEPVRLLQTVFHRDGNYYQLIVRTSMVEEDDLRRELLIALIWLYAGLVFLVLLLNNLLLRRIWKPFYDLLAKLKMFRVDRPSPDLKDETKIEEFRQLGKAVQSMMDRNARTYASHKQFIENASHELQTPLAIGLGKLESLAEITRLNDQQAALLAAAIEGLERLTRLNKSLLLLSRIENSQFQDIQPVRINDVVKKVLDDFRDQSDFRKLELVLYEDAICSYAMDPELAMVLVSNLVKNAMVHSAENSKIEIRIRQNAIVVSNPATEPMDPSTMFQRFRPGRQTGSTGLGLAIIKAICDMYGFRVNYRFHHSIHEFRLDFNV